MVGRDLLASYESGDSRERERRRIEELDHLPPGKGLPVADFRMTGRVGRRVSVRATGVRVDADGGPAVLSIYVDDTERRAAEEAVRRSEAMLSHLVATSPDVITLTDLATGRYAMVNQTFERITGYTAAEVVGRTWVELGIWQPHGSSTTSLAPARTGPRAGPAHRLCHQVRPAGADAGVGRHAS
jgi:PAS domain S-box-containing protein